MNRPWKVILVMIGIFLAGSVAGAFIALAVEKSDSRRRSGPDQWVPARLRTMSERLQLTPEQIDRIRPIMKREGDELAKLREHGMRETRAILERLEKQIAAELTPEQVAKFEEYNKEVRERTRRMMERRKLEQQQKREGAPPKK
jgi:Spy/CpxP family protein refolding chaperone